MRIHFVAIGGAIMHNLAICLHKKGLNISGSDDIIFDPAKSNLEKHGLLPEKIGFFEENITESLDAIILGMHAKTDNIELKKAQKLGLPIYSFPEFIYQQSKDKTRVVVAGSHGKTSTTAMIMHVLKHQNLDFDYLVGANLDGFEDNVKISDAPIIVLEGDEYLSSPIEMKSKFHFYHPHITMITGIAWDHVNVFPTWESYTNTFKEYIENIEKDGALIYFEGDKTLSELSQFAVCKASSYHTPTYKIEDGVSYLLYQDQQIALEIFGEHNLQNLEGARMVCNALSIDNESFYKAISTFKGAARRLEKIKSEKGVTAFKDFAHSPSKLEATIKAVKQQFSNKKLLACMELHTFSSTDPKFLSEFKDSMLPADVAIIYMSDKAFEIKNKAKIDDAVIHQNFNQSNIIIQRNPKGLENEMNKYNADDYVFLMMTSGNFDGFNLNDFFENK
jgi:UDP-N-acetylmuramate: L-alanyl-gamma-D-glutamyl-meso-diaminopimelate ligase